MVLTKEQVYEVARLAAEQITAALLPFVGLEISEQQLYRAVFEYDPKMKETLDEIKTKFN